MRVTTIAVAILVLTGTGSALADERTGSPVHRSTGLVLAASSSMVVMRQGEGVHRLGVDARTRIAIGDEHAVARIGPGDWIAEECVPDGRGGHRAVHLTLTRPAWMEIAGPEQ